jgi:hypothetical protein
MNGTHKTFKGLPVLKTATAETVALPPLLIKPDMEEYSGWDYADHIKWVNELTGLNIPLGSIIATDEHCTEVWLLARDHYRTKCRLIYSDEEQDAQ